MKRVSLYETLWHIRTLAFSFYILPSCPIHYEVHFCLVGSVAILSIFSPFYLGWGLGIWNNVLRQCQPCRRTPQPQPSLGSRRSWAYYRPAKPLVVIWMDSPEITALSTQDFRISMEIILSTLSFGRQRINGCLCQGFWLVSVDRSLDLIWVCI